MAGLWASTGTTLTIGGGSVSNTFGLGHYVVGGGGAGGAANTWIGAGTLTTGYAAPLYQQQQQQMLMQQMQQYAQQEQAQQKYNALHANLVNEQYKTEQRLAKPKRATFLGELQDEMDSWLK